MARLPKIVNRLTPGDASGTYPSVVAVAAPTGVAATDTAAIQAALDAVPVAGGTVYLRAGTYVTTGALTVSHRTLIQGQGGLDSSGNANTKIQVSSATADGFTFAVSGCAVVDLALFNNAGSTPTAGAGLHFQHAAFARVTRVGVIGFWNDVQIDAGAYWTLTDSTFLDPVNYGVYVRNTDPGDADYGDQVIHGCTLTPYYFSRNAAAAVRWESGGGLKFTGNKINGIAQPEGHPTTGQFVIGFDLAMADGVGTSVCLITGNSIEACSNSMVRIGQAGTTGSFSKVTITGNEMGIASAGSRGVNIVPNGSGYISDITISNNVFNVLAIGIYARLSARVNVGPNIFVNISNTAVLIDTGMTDYLVQPQVVQGDNLNYLIDNSAVTANHGPYAMAGVDLHREIGSTTSTSTYTYLYRLSVPAYGAGRLKLTMPVNVSGVGSGVVVAERTWTKGSSGNVTMATMGTDVTVASLDFIFDTTTTAGDILIGVRLHAAGGGTDVAGRVHLTAIGPLTTVKKGS